MAQHTELTAARRAQLAAMVLGGSATGAGTGSGSAGVVGRTGDHCHGATC